MPLPKRSDWRNRTIRRRFHGKGKKREGKMDRKRERKREVKKEEENEEKKDEKKEDKKKEKTEENDTRQADKDDVKMEETGADVKEEEEAGMEDMNPEPDAKSAGKARRRKPTDVGESRKQREMRLTIAEKVLSKVGNSKKMLGAHVSASGALQNAIYNARAQGCRSFAFFIRNRRLWYSKPLEQSAIDAWWKAVKETGFPLSQVLPHASYLMNPGSPDPEKLKKTRAAMLDECQRAEKLGISYYNFHPGSSTGAESTNECIRTACATIDYLIENTKYLILVVEAVAGQGYTIGDTFEQIRQIIDGVKDKGRVGVCLDTCHIFAAGYDIRTREAYDRTMKEFGDVVGFEYLKAIHLTDSKGDLGSKVDRHENIGKGKIGSSAFALLMNDPRLDGMPMILETTKGAYPKEMIKLYEMAQ